MKDAFKFLSKKYPNYGKYLPSTEINKLYRNPFYNNNNTSNNIFNHSNSEVNSENSTQDKDSSKNTYENKSSDSDPLSIEKADSIKNKLNVKSKNDCNTHNTNDIHLLEPNDLEKVYFWWRELIIRSFHPLVLPEQFIKKLYHHFETENAYKVYSDVYTALQRLIDYNQKVDFESASENPIDVKITLGIISNSDHRVFDILNALNMKKFFGYRDVFLSYFIGKHKPQREIFEYVRNSLLNFHVLKNPEFQLMSKSGAHLLNDFDEHANNSQDQGYVFFIYLFFHAV